MKTSLVSLAVASALTLGALQAAQASAAEVKPAVVAAEVEALKAQLAVLQERLAAIEAAQQAQSAQVAAATEAAQSQVSANAEQQDAIDRTTDSLAQTRANVGEWVGRFQWKGDLRYRNETIDQEFTARERNRDRIRARFGFFAKVNDTVRVEMQASTTEGGDSRSSNQTLTNANSRKALDLDTAYAEWAPSAQWKLTAGKMRTPWVRTASYFYDGDVNPEGLAVSWQQGPTGFFGSAFYTQLAERSNFADSNMAGAQFGWRGDVADGARLTLAAGYFDHGAVEGYNAFLDGNAANAFGHSTTTSAAICRSGIATCLANDFNIAELQGELAMTVAGKPLTLFVDYAQNGAADFRNVSATPSSNIPEGLDTAYAFGATFGRASAPRTWEIGYVYQKTEKDSLYGQWIDSDFAAGNTDGDGSVFKFGYAFARNWRLNATYIVSKTNNDVAVRVPTGFLGCTATSTSANCFRTDRDYKRLQIDLNMTF